MKCFFFKCDHVYLCLLQSVGGGGIQACRAGADTPESTADHFSDTSREAGAGTRTAGEGKRFGVCHAAAAAARGGQTGGSGAI